ncbi:hypothetical protein X975_12924, partial [Stegodyphus mimosarum]
MIYDLRWKFPEMPSVSFGHFSKVLDYQFKTIICRTSGTMSPRTTENVGGILISESPVRCDIICRQHSAAQSSGDNTQ